MSIAPEKKGDWLLYRSSPSSAVRNMAQATHRGTAISHLIECVGQGRKRLLGELSSDELLNSFDVIGREWVMETVAQGAYVREYHYWETDCKKYFRQQLISNDIDKKIVDKSIQKKRDESFVDVVRRQFSNFNLNDDAGLIDCLDEMRDLVNKIKHDPNLLREDSIKLENFFAKNSVVVEFWEYLSLLETAR